jgi:hypothetical protein
VNSGAGLSRTEATDHQQSGCGDTEGHTEGAVDELGADADKGEQKKVEHEKTDSERRSDKVRGAGSENRRSATRLIEACATTSGPERHQSERKCRGGIVAGNLHVRSFVLVRWCSVHASIAGARLGQPTTRA